MHRSPAVAVMASSDVKSLQLAFLPGTGRMGGALARLHAKHGFKAITLGSRDVARASEAAGLMQSQLPVGAPTIKHAGLEAAVEGADVVFWVAGPTGSACKTVALDSGQSTGGFTDCLLQHGAAKVIGIDCGFAQLHERMRRDERVVVMEKFNVRYLLPEHIAPYKIDIATLDLSFISVLKVIPAVIGVMQPDGQLLVLIKPQFEAGRQQVSSGGVVRDPKVHAEVIQRVTSGVEELGFRLMGVIESPLKGEKSGNTEFLAHFVRDVEKSGAGAAEVAAAAAARLRLEPDELASLAGPP